jgi:hypothetical protein
MSHRFVPPSGLLDILREDRISAMNRNLHNTPLRVGVITQIHEIDDEKNSSKLFPEYDIVTSQQNGEMGSTFVEYTNCIGMDSIGGIADFFEMKLRKYKDEDYRKTYQFDKQDGTIVLILCIDGHSDKAIIIGGVPNPVRKTVLKKDKEIHMEGEFNGIRFYIDKDGAIKLTQKTPTNQKDGKPISEDNAGTFITIEKDGSIEFGDDKLDKELAKGNKKEEKKEGEKEEEEEEEEEESGDDIKYEKFRIDRTKKMVDLEAREDINVKTDKNLNIKTKESVKAEVKKDIEFIAEGSAKYTAKSTIDIEADSQINVKTGNLIVDVENGIQIQAQQIIAQGKSILLGSATAPAVIQATIFIGTGNLGAPVACSAVGEFSKEVFI